MIIIIIIAIIIIIFSSSTRSRSSSTTTTTTSNSSKDQNIILSDDLRPLVPNCITSNWKLKPANHRSQDNAIVLPINKLKYNIVRWSDASGFQLYFAKYKTETKSHMPKRPEGINKHYDEVQGDVLRPPHGT